MNYFEITWLIGWILLLICEFWPKPNDGPPVFKSEQLPENIRRHFEGLGHDY